MEWIGFSRNDPNQTKFVFDDSVVLTSEPPQYNIRFLESGEQTSILCSDVFKLKPVKPMKRKTVMSDTPKPEQIGETITVPVVPVPTLTDDEEIQREIEESLKPTWMKNNDNTVTPETPETPNITATEGVKVKKGRKKNGTLNMSSVVTGLNSSDTTVRLAVDTRHKYEYKTIMSDLDNTTQIETLLNEYGEEGWELVHFDTTSSIIGKSRLFCILKRIKE